MKKLPLVLLIPFLLLASCKDDYFYEENIPSWLGKSIYDRLEKDGKYTNFVRLIDDLGYTEVLSKTGSKTLFVADDDAFARFFRNNPWGITGYEGLSMAQKKILMNSAMLNNAILIEKLATVEGPVKGQALRRQTASAVVDSVNFEKGDDLPNSAYWTRFKETGIRLAKDNTAVPMLCFTAGQMNAHNISNSDFSILQNGVDRKDDDAYIYNIRVKERDITCQNGYIHVLEDVLVPPSNMAEVMRKAPEVRTFSSFLERYAAPYYNASLTSQLRTLGVEADSAFVKGYFSKRSNTVSQVLSSTGTVTACYAPDGKTLVPYFLPFDPGWNMYKSSDVSGSYQTDMGVIFAPSDAALQTYFSTGAGRSLIDRYGSTDKIPDKVLVDLVGNHMKPSFLGTTPSLFPTIVDDAQETMGIKASDVEKTYLSSNGVVYVVNTVYPPALYSSVMFPTTINDNMKVFNWAITNTNYSPYLLSMVNTYSFLIPKDNFTYIVPTSLEKAQPVAWKFHYSDKSQSVYASVHPYNATTHVVSGDSISVVTAADQLKNHLQDMLDYHIVVGNIEDGNEYYRTKGGGTIRIASSGNKLYLAGGGDIDRGVTIPVDEIYDQTKETNGRGNGKSYVLKAPVQSPLQSVYSILQNTPEFSKFFALAQGADDLWAGDATRAAKYGIFYKDASQSGLDLNVRFLNTYHYTLYVPTNDQVQSAIDRHIVPTWDDVERANNGEITSWNTISSDNPTVLRDTLASMIVRFVRYHFQDNSIFLDKGSVSGSYQTATLNNSTETFYKLALSGGNHSLNIKTGSGETAHVLTSGGKYNIMARDFKFNTASPATATQIITSSYIVIHQVDKCLYFQ